MFFKPLYRSYERIVLNLYQLSLRLCGADFHERFHIYLFRGESKYRYLHQSLMSYSLNVVVVM